MGFKHFSFKTFALTTATLISLAMIGCSQSPSGPGQSTDPSAPEPSAFHVLLEDHWMLRAAADVEADGAEISSSGFSTDPWYPTSVPTTVLAALVDNGLHPEPYFARNLEKIDTEPFQGPWWYRTTFELDALDEGLALVFDGINYRANIWLNGRRIADDAEMLGSFRQFEIDIRDHAVQGENVLAVEVHPPRPGDFTLGFVDWNPVPPDRNMGLWRQVWLRRVGAVSMSDVVVNTELNDTGTEADLTVLATLRNHTDRPIQGRLLGRIEDLSFEQAYELAAGESKDLRVAADSHPTLRMSSPRLWWPHTMGEPHLYPLDLIAEADGTASDRQQLRFGVREVSDYFNAQGHRGYRINGKDILIRGGGWVDDLMLDDTDAKIEAQMDYARHLGLNTVRLEGFWGSSRKIYDTADENGILLMPGWSCQWEWQEYLGKEVDEQYGGVLTEQDMDLVTGMWADQVRWLRRHPSIFVWVLASDLLPKPDLEQRYAEIMPGLDATRPLLAACSDRQSEVSGPTGVKMNGPYDYVPPAYWYVNRDRGGAFGFNTETGPGPQPPPMESLRRMLPEENLWPIDEMWEYHCGRHEFNTLKRYEKALNARYGPSSDVETFTRKAQAANYEAMRAMFEAFAVRRPEATGVVQWMLNSAWPELYWQLYDHYLMPNGAFYGARRANAEVGLVYDYGDASVWVQRDDPTRSLADTTANIRLFDLQSRELHQQSIALTDDFEVSQSIAQLGEQVKASPVTFLDLRLLHADGSTVASNFYWLSSKDDVLDDAAATWFYTPTVEFADFTDLSDLAPTTLRAEARLEARDPDGWHHIAIEIENTGDRLAFFLELRIVDPHTDQSILPVLLDDNYVSLLPGESRRLTARIPSTVVARPAGEWVLRYSGWNVEAGEEPLGP